MVNPEGRSALGKDEAFESLVLSCGWLLPLGNYHLTVCGAENSEVLAVGSMLHRCSGNFNAR